MRLRSLSAVVGLPVLVAVPLLAQPANAADAPMEVGTLQAQGLSTFVAAATDGHGQTMASAAALSADTVRFPAPGSVGPVTIGDQCFDVANGPGLAAATTHPVDDGFPCLSFRSVPGVTDSYFFVADDDLSLVDGMRLTAAPDSGTLVFTDRGTQFDRVTTGEAVAPTLTTTTTTPGAALRGTATPGSHVLVFADGALLCDAEADAGGSWSCSPAAALTVGTHTVQLGSQSAAGQLTPLVDAQVVVTAAAAHAE